MTAAHAAPTKQSVASVGRQVIAILASVYGVLSASVSQLHLPPVVSGILTATGPLILAVEHWVSDPSTGNAAAVIDAVAAEPDAARIEGLVRASIAKILGLDAATGDLPAPAKTVAPAAK